MTSKDLLASYPAFYYLRIKGLPFQSALVGWNGVIASICAVALASSAARDGTLWMTGRGTGFFEHPGILIFLLAQAYVPFVAIRAVSHQINPSTFSASALSEQFVGDHVAFSLIRFQTSVLRGDNRGRLLYALLTSIGIIAYAWNCYQNQLPLKIVGFDFWDSIAHPWGYWSTRVYKLYIWIFLIPAITHFLVLSVWSISGIIASTAKEERGLHLDPYHEDGCGGVKVLIDSLINPLVPVALVGAALAFSAFVVHEKLDVTTVGGFTLALAFFSLIYIRPATSLRGTIAREKFRQIREIRAKQRDLYQKLREEERSKDPDIAQAILTLSEICKNISSIPNWPQVERALRIVALAGSSPIIAWGVKQMGNAARQFLSSG